MTTIKRAWTAVARRGRRSLTIALIMTLIFTLLIGTLTVQQTMAQLKQSVERNIRAGFSIASKQPSGEVPMDIAQRVQRLDKVKTHNFQAETTAGLPGKQLVDVAGSGVQPTDLLAVWGAGLAVIIIAVFLASRPITQSTPKELLTEVD